MELRKLVPQLPTDLETVVLKCLRKDRADRYGGAEALTQDLRRFVRGEAVEARPQLGVEKLARGRRQVELEGFELVQKQTEMAMVLRQKVLSHPLLSKYFRFLTVADMIPAEYRESGIERYYDLENGWSRIWRAWADDEFALDATRLTLYVGAVGVIKYNPLASSSKDKLIV